MTHVTAHYIDIKIATNCISQRALLEKVLMMGLKGVVNVKVSEANTNYDTESKIAISYYHIRFLI